MSKLLHVGLAGRQPNRTIFADSSREDTLAISTDVHNVARGIARKHRLADDFESFQVTRKPRRPWGEVCLVRLLINHSAARANTSGDRHALSRAKEHRHIHI